MRPFYAQTALVACTLILGANTVFAVPADPERVWTFHQPDGTPFEAVLIGDEIFAYYQTPDGKSTGEGKVIVEDPKSRWWYYAKPKADGTLERTTQAVGVAGLKAPSADLLNVEKAQWLDAVARIGEARAAELAGPSSSPQMAPPSGTVRGVLLLVNFSDTATTFTSADLDGLMNTTGYNSNGALGSVSDYYYECSYGAFTLQMDVYGWFTLPQTRAFYGQNSGGAGTDQNPRQMIIDALAAADASVDFANYDADGDGKVDVFGVTHQGQGEESGGGTDAIWSHTSNLATAVTVDGKSVQDYFTAPERYDAMSLATIGVYCHEMGHHMFNLPDLYDLDGSSYGVGRWSLMGYGTWLGPNGAKPCHPDPWCKMALGWLSPTRIISPQAGISLPSYDATATALLIPVDPYQDGEYFLVCNRYKRATAEAATGFDQYLPGSGALVLHIDDYVANNRSEARKKVDVEEADGLNHLDTKSNQGDSGDLYPNGASAFSDSSSPNTRDNVGGSTGIVVDSFTGAGTASMTCSVTPLASLLGSSIGYDLMGSEGKAFGYDGVDSGCVRFTAAVTGILERVKTYFVYFGTTNYTVNVYSAWNAGAPTGLLTSQSGSHTGIGYEEITLASPQSVAGGTDFYVQVTYDSGYLFPTILPIALDRQCDGRSWASSDGATYTNLTPANGLPYDLNIRADLQTASGEVVSVSLDRNSWDLTGIHLAETHVASFTATNDGNVAIDLNITATDGAGGWTIEPAPGANAFAVDLADPAIALSKSDQIVATNIAPSYAKNIDLTYNSPTSDTIGNGVSQAFTITLLASKAVP